MGDGIPSGRDAKLPRGARRRGAPSRLTSPDGPRRSAGWRAGHGRRGPGRSAATVRDPADSPDTVMLPVSPPKAAMSSRTQVECGDWSGNPKLARSSPIQVSVGADPVIDRHATIPLWAKVRRRTKATPRSGELKVPPPGSRPSPAGRPTLRPASIRSTSGSPLHRPSTPGGDKLDAGGDVG